MENLRGAALMTGAMGAFALEDMFIKLLARDLPVGQILMLLGAAGAAVFALIAAARGEAVLSRDAFARPVLWRNAGEIIGTTGFVTALSLTPLVSASAILQALPLAVTLGAALFLGARVGWRRWSAILAGMAGVLMILRPGFDAFEPASLFAVLGVVGLALRDLATRVVAPRISSFQLSAYGFAMLVPLGLAMLALGAGPVPLAAGDLGLLAALVVLGVVGYYLVTAAMRVGEIAFVTPFRYSRMLFALAVGVTVFGERPDGWTLAGAALIVASGIYALLRERALSGSGGA
ncbi:MAG: DMT family transporter [Rhodobacteraceae bacterium]|jgi:drug/metabolite transporter (DMT)-like permease|nr:DMT family transporter [Paracoccaceae bacterium]HBG97522.1 EamA family transporter [Paracoccaceae bacterium]